MKALLPTLLLVSLSQGAFAAEKQTSPPQQTWESMRWPGRQSDGSVLLPNLWSLQPAGTQVDVADFPVNIAVHPEGKFAAILHNGPVGI